MQHCGEKLWAKENPCVCVRETAAQLTCMMHGAMVLSHQSRLDCTHFNQLASKDPAVHRMAMLDVLRVHPDGRLGAMQRSTPSPAAGALPLHARLRTRSSVSSAAASELQPHIAARTCQLQHRPLASCSTRVLCHAATTGEATTSGRASDTPLPSEQVCEASRNIR